MHITIIENNSVLFIIFHQTWPSWSVGGSPVNVGKPPSRFIQSVRGWRPPRTRRRSLLFEADAVHSSSMAARRSNLANYSRDEKKAACEKKTGRRWGEKRGEESVKENEEENGTRQWTRDQTWEVSICDIRNIMFHFRSIIFE